jgi:hypothetical protein
VDGLFVFEDEIQSMLHLAHVQGPAGADGRGLSLRAANRLHSASRFLLGRIQYNKFSHAGDETLK